MKDRYTTFRPTIDEIPQCCVNTLIDCKASRCMGWIWLSIDDAIDLEPDFVGSGRKRTDYEVREKFLRYRGRCGRVR